MRFEASRRLTLVAFGLSAAVALPVQAGQSDANVAALGQAYEREIRPLLRRYCHECHADDRTEADIDLAEFVTMTDVRERPPVWQKVSEMLASHQMPPKKSKQPSDVEQTRLLTWVRDYLTTEADALAGDPGRVVLRRLGNSEYAYTVRDLTGVDSLDPVREFPIDGAAGEGFTNTGDALVMSPSLIGKYLDAGKEIASHAVLTPDGIRFSRHATRRDWTDESLARIREFYREFTDDHGGSAVNLQGIKFDTNQGGRLPLEKYLEATLAERDALNDGKKTIEVVSRARGLNAKYLGSLWRMLTADAKGTRSLLLDRVRARWRNARTEADAAALIAEITPWQPALWKFNTIGHIGREGGPKAWMEPVNPIVARQEFKLKLPESSDGKDVVLYLTANDAGDGNDGDYVVWKNPRLEGGDRPALQLCYVAGVLERLVEVRQDMLARTANYLAAAAAASETKPEPNRPELAARYGVDVDLLELWLDYLNVASAGPVEVQGHFEEKMSNAANHDFINGWGTQATPLIMANSSDQEVRIPGIARPHSVVAHPSPTLFAAVGWRSPINGPVTVQARVADAHPECGNGVEWFVQHRKDKSARNLWQGDFGTRGSATMPAKKIEVHKGELVSFILGPRQGAHGCDLTEINLVITEANGAERVWDLAKDVSGNILESNPRADRFGNEETWHFYKGLMTEVRKQRDRTVTPPVGSLVALWQAEKNVTKRRALADRVQSLATGKPPADKDSPDGVLFDQLQTLVVLTDNASILQGAARDARFGKHPLGHAMDAADLVVKAPAVLEFRVPAELAEGRELVVTGELDAKHGREGAVQLQVATTKPDRRDLSAATPIIVTDGSEARRRVASAFDEFREWFPGALCYARIVPVDEAVTLTLFYREDEHLQRLLLDDQQTARLDRLWDELQFISHEPLALVVAFEQISEFATQDRPDLVKAFKPLRKPIEDRADAFRRRLIDTEPMHSKAVQEFADRAWRRRLTDAERQGLRDLYRRLRDSEIGHDEAIRLTLARLLTSPAFLYRLERPAVGEGQAPITNVELASRLSYFLWASLPDSELRRAAQAGELTNEKTLMRQARRMLDDDRTRRLAIEFACQWLHIRDFDRNDDKNEKLYPEFARLRGEMYEESVRFFEDMFRNDGSILGLLTADHTFLNESLAQHYGIGGVTGPEWRRVDGIRDAGRGGVLGMATVLSKQSGASRTSAILRGNWVFETLLGERLPRPPANVPQLPDAVPSGLTARQLIERHSSAAECARCHTKIDPYGFALEQYDAIGRFRPRPMNTKTKLADGKTMEGIEGLRDYLAKDRHDDVVRQFCRKLLGYALGREVQLSDEPLLAEMRRRLVANDYRFSVAVEAVVTSRQFLDVRSQGIAEE